MSKHSLGRVERLQDEPAAVVFGFLRPRRKVLFTWEEVGPGVGYFVNTFEKVGRRTCRANCPATKLAPTRLAIEHHSRCQIYDDEVRQHEEQHVLPQPRTATQTHTR